jgi:hypothetical protein
MPFIPDFLELKTAGTESTEGTELPDWSLLNAEIDHHLKRLSEEHKQSTLLSAEHSLMGERFERLGNSDLARYHHSVSGTYARRINFIEEIMKEFHGLREPSSTPND